MDKAWLQFPRASSEYQQGARNFVHIATKGLKDTKIICPCIDCRNTDPDYRTGSVVLEHLVRRGMDPTYTTWVFHGEKSSASAQVDQGIEMTNAHKMCFDAHQLNEELLMMRMQIHRVNHWM